MILSDINDALITISGIGEKNKKLFEKAGINNVGDLLSYIPRRYSDRTQTVSFREAVLKHEATVQVEVTDCRHIRKAHRLTLTKIMVTDGNDYGSLVCYNQPYLADVIVVGKKYNITGRFVFNYGEFQISSFEYEEVDKTVVINNIESKIIPVYPLTERLTQKAVRNAVFHALKKYLPQIEDELPAELIQKNQLIGKADCLRNMHYPVSYPMYLACKKTMIYEEFFYQQLFLLVRKNKTANTTKRRPQIAFKYRDELIKHLSFELTDYQKKALAEIEADLFGSRVMGRLLQGDVGCGKTVVAALAMVSVVECGLQCAIMVPTEMLSKQHYENIRRMCEPLNIRVAHLHSKLKKSERSALLNQIKNGEVNIIVGTQSLFSKDVIYNNLGLAVIDEQHRFGVEQRINLLQKGETVDLLLMTATPIPQSMALSLYGDLDLTIMKGKITGRKPVKTWLIDDDKQRIAKMYDWIKTLLDNNGRAIIVYARIDAGDEEDSLGLKDLESEYQNLSAVFADYGTAMVHSKVSMEEKDAIIGQFKSGEIKLLVATTVVEVGMDIPDANVIVIENAERYGLATLHQLRGRVGRNDKDSYMVLISKLDGLTEEGRRRLNIIKSTTDGFAIAEEDLMLRGPGDFIGLRQSGLPEQLVNIRQELALLETARDDARHIYETDPNLEKIGHYNIKKSFLHRMEKIQMQEKNNRQL